MTRKKYSFILILLLPPILITGIALLLIFIPLPASYPQPASHVRNLPVAILTGILGMIWAITLTIYSIKSLVSTGKGLDSTLTAMGLKASNYLLFGRDYRGEINGYLVEVQFTPNRTPHNNLLNIRIGTSIKKRMSIGINKPLQGCIDCDKVEILPNELGNLQVYAEDKQWAQKILYDPMIIGKLHSLLDDSKRLGIREFHILNRQCWLHARPTQQLTEKDLQVWLQTMLELSYSIEKIN